MREVSLFNRKVFFKDMIIMLFIMILPFLFYLYKLVPEVKIWETKFFSYDSKYFEDASVFVWVLFTKIFTMLILILWFLTCKHWWRKILFIPIVIESHKILNILNSDLYLVDNDEYLYSIPFSICLILILLLLAKKINYYSLSINTSNELDKEINGLLNELSLFKEENFKSVKKELTVLRNQKETMNNEAYLKKLIELRNTITNL